MNMDLNSDIGESYGIYKIGADENLIPYLTSANIACGFHGGDPQVMQRTVRLCKTHGVGIGAHPGYPDVPGFGRRVIPLSESQVENIILYQLGALAAFTRAQAVPLRHVKPHGALYNHAAQDMPTARAIARAVACFDAKLILVGLANSRLIQAAMELGVPYAREGFIDRAYQSDGTLVSRAAAGAVITSPARAARAAVRLACQGVARTIDGKTISLEVDTLCLHGDTPGAARIAAAARRALRAAGVTLQAMSA
jgi:UPF0271 protein